MSETGPRRILGFGPTIPFTKDIDYPWLRLNFDKAIDLTGFRWATASLLVALICLGAAIYVFSKIITRLTSSPLVFDDDATRQKTHESLPTSYRDLKWVGLLVLLGIGFYLLGVWECALKAEELHPFGLSLLVVVHVILTVEFLTLSVQNSAWLLHRPKFVTGSPWRYAPVWILTALATLCIFFGIWMFGRYPGAYILSDAIFALVALLVLPGLTFVGWQMGGASGMVCYNWSYR